MNKKHIFTPREKKTFLDILSKHRHITESKETDGATLQAKTYAWDSITKEYNASPHCDIQVTSKQLRRLWMNLKQRQRGAHKNDSSETALPLYTVESSSSADQQCQKVILDRDYINRETRTEELHQLEVELLTHKIREAKAKADLAELILSQRQSLPDFQVTISENDEN